MGTKKGGASARFARGSSRGGDGPPGWVLSGPHGKGACQAPAEAEDAGRVPGGGAGGVAVCSGARGSWSGALG